MAKVDFVLKRGKSLGFAFRRCGVGSSVPDVKVTRLDDNEEILDLIYAPDPNTGYARSDVAIMLSRSTEPVVKEFISRVLMKPVSGSNCGDNADIALELVPQYGETEDMYIERLKGFITESSNE